MSLPKGLVWITGASSGIGWATALHLARQGFDVAASARNRAALNALAGKNTNIHPYPMDVADPLQRESVYNRIRKDLGPVDILINNAGYGIRGTVEDVPAHMMRDIFDVNVFAPIALTRLVLPEMRARREGKIVMVSSLVGRFTPPISGVYAATKHALESLSDALRMELMPWSVNVILVEPGPIRTNFGAYAKRESEPLLFNDASPYRKFYKLFLENPQFKKHQYWGTASVAEVIRRAVEAENPKPRYPVHPAAIFLPWLRWLIPDCIGDRIFANKFGFTSGSGS